MSSSEAFVDSGGKCRHCCVENCASVVEEAEQQKRSFKKKWSFVGLSTVEESVTCLIKNCATKELCNKKDADTIYDKTCYACAKENCFEYLEQSFRNLTFGEDSTNTVSKTYYKQQYLVKTSKLFFAKSVLQHEGFPETGLIVPRMILDTV